MVRFSAWFLLICKDGLQASMRHHQSPNALDLLKKSFNRLIFSSLALSGLYASHQHAGLKLHSSTVNNTAFLPLIESTQHKETCDTAARLTSQHHHTWDGKSGNCQTAGILNPIA